MEPWIENSEPFILVGPEGCGKDMIIRYAFSSEGASRAGARGGAGGGGGSGAKRLKTSITVLHCNARTTAEHVITKVTDLPRVSTSVTHSCASPSAWLYSFARCSSRSIALSLVGVVHLNLPRKKRGDTYTNHNPPNTCIGMAWALGPAQSAANRSCAPRLKE